MPLIMPILAKPAALKALKEARGMLENVTPMKMNCGKLCDGACCKEDESGDNGMLLFPYEAELYKKPIEGFAYHLVDDDTLFKGGKRFVCEGSCPREHRPLACRLFPLRIAIASDDNGIDATAEAEIDPRAWICCPILEQGGLRAMSMDFKDAVKRAGEVLMENDYMLEALHNEQRLIDEMRQF